MLQNKPAPAGGAGGFVPGAPGTGGFEPDEIHDGEGIIFLTYQS
jgi:hypothetical protein